MMENKPLTIVSIADIHFGALDPKYTYETLRQQFIFKISNINFDILTICGDLFDAKFMSNNPIISYALLFMDEIINILCNDVLSICPYNTLVLAHHTEYLLYVADEIKKRMPDKIVCIIHGKTKPKERDAVKEILKNNNNCILVASYGCIGTGITLSNLCFGVLFESFKSGTINMQSLGRGLGLSKLKDKYIVYDFIDCFDESVSIKSILKQGKEKVKIYENNKYDYNIVVKNI